MTKYISCCSLKRHREKAGFYTVEAAILLPLIILAVLTIGYFIRADSAWETAMHKKIDSCSFNAATQSIGIHTQHIEETINLRMPLGFGGDYSYSGKIKYRDFKGHKYSANGLGAEGLESEKDSERVWIFPLSGTKYHDEHCTYVKATIHSCILTESLKRRYSPCALCHSEKMTLGSIAFCFYGDDTSYHYGSCRSIDRHTIVIDKSEAEKKGYRPCSKCGG